MPPKLSFRSDPVDHLTGLLYFVVSGSRISQMGAPGGGGGRQVMGALFRVR
jgi:hypothetical protein